MPLFVVFTSISVLAVVLGILFNISQGQLLLTYHSHNMSFNLWVVTYISIAILFLICSFTKIIIKYNTFKKSLFERKHDNKIQKIKAAWIAYLESPITYKHNTLTELNNLICEDDMDLNNFMLTRPQRQQNKSSFIKMAKYKAKQQPKLSFNSCLYTD